MEILPNIRVPEEQEEVEREIGIEFNRFMGHSAVLERSDGLDPDARRGSAQSESNLNHLLDHWPNGVHRDIQPLDFKTWETPPGPPPALPKPELLDDDDEDDPLIPRNIRRGRD